jgi:hypothetical protein
VSATTSFINVPIVSETMVTNIPPLVSDTIRARYEEGPVSQGIISPGGGLSFRLHPTTLGAFLYAVTGVCTTTGVGCSYQHSFIPVTSAFTADFAINPYTIEIYRGVDEAHFYHDACANRMSMDISGGQFCRGSVDWICRTHSTAAKGTPTFPAGDEMTWNQASVSLGGAASTIFDNVTVTLDNALGAYAALDGTKVNRRIQRNGFRTLAVAGTVDFPNNDEFDKFRAGTEQRFELTLLTGVIVGSFAAPIYETLNIIVPSLRYDSFPINVGGPSRLTVGFAGRGVYNTGSGHAMKITLINSHPTY